MRRIKVVSLPNRRRDAAVFLAVEAPANLTDVLPTA